MCFVDTLTSIHTSAEVDELLQFLFHNRQQNKHTDQIRETHREQSRIREIDHVARSHRRTDNNH